MGHTYANLLVHVVFSTKDRRPTIRPEFEERLRHGDPLVGEVVDLAVLRQEADAAILVEESANPSLLAFTKQDCPAAIADVRNRSGASRPQRPAKCLTPRLAPGH